MAQSCGKRTAGQAIRQIIDLGLELNQMERACRPARVGDLKAMRAIFRERVKRIEADFDLLISARADAAEPQPVSREPHAGP